MLEFFGFIGFLVMIFFFVYPLLLGARVKELKGRLKELESRIDELESEKFVSVSKETQKTQGPVREKKSTLTTLPPPVPEFPKKREPSPILEPADSAPSRSLASFWKSPLWEKIEKSLAQNWTGIFGTVILVMGVGFLGIYAALKMSPFLRFLMVLGIAGGLFACSIYLSTREFWKQIAYWLRSAAGAVVLFACLGSVSFQGMKWVETESLGLLLVLLGVFVNLSLAWFASFQKFASLHIVLSLLALAILPMTDLVYGVAIGVSVFGLFLSYRSQWEYHLIYSVLSFAAINFLYREHVFSSGASPESVGRMYGMIGTLLVGSVSVLVHYRKVYSSQKFDKFAFLSHFISWFATAIGFAFYATGSKWNAPILVLAAIFVFLHARRARTVGIRWLYLTDTLVSLGIACLGVVFLSRWELHYLSVNLILSFLFFSFFFVASEEKEKTLMRVGGALLHFSLFFFLVLLWFYKTEENGDLRSFLCFSTSLGMISLSLAIQILDSTRYSDRLNSWDDIYGLSEKLKVSPAGILCGFLVSALCFETAGGIRDLWILSCLGILLLFLRQRTNWNGLGMGMFPFTIAIHFLVFSSWENIGEVDRFLRALPVIFFCFSAIPLSKIRGADAGERYLSQPGVILFSLHLALQIFVLGNPTSSFLPGIVWLLFSLFYLEFYRFLIEKKGSLSIGWKRGFSEAAPIWASFALVFAGLFLGAHILVHLQSEFSVGFLKVRLLVQIFAICAFVYWASSSFPLVEENPIWFRNCLPLFWELALVVLITAVSLEVPNTWLPVAWILLAFLTEAVSRTALSVSRFHFYSLVLFWLSCGHTAFLSSSNATPSIFWADQEWVGGLVSLFFQTGYLILIYLRPSFLPQSSEGFPLLVDRFAGKIDSRVNMMIFYPLFITVALFLFWSFDTAFLTLLWMTEVFVVFLVGLFLRESHFRYVSLTAMMLCLLRLIFWDLSKSSTITRAFVFLGVGGILILMNTLYGKYKVSEGKKSDVQ
ncbi:DUF2339 domain-containing protein [Leptospira fletcheri]|uniref:DUF2339 domain-containing protein n=1 Tax=Leptospira fletcheri TaxID=2484981 RepID=A0A4R9GG53_9LEPT|nr:DUF2339 domain-containing protein [Leptospira fletcheri]TGK11650.1 DUF2339 domain-containing protein [Leptospira fletcheri]